MSCIIKDFNLKAMVEAGLVNESALEDKAIYRDVEGNVTIVDKDDESSLESVVLETETKVSNFEGIVLPVTALKAMLNAGMIKSGIESTHDITTGPSTTYPGLILAFIKERSTATLADRLNAPAAKKATKAEF